MGKVENCFHFSTFIFIHLAHVGIRTFDFQSPVHERRENNMSTWRKAILSHLSNIILEEKPYNFFLDSSEVLKK